MAEVALDYNASFQGTVAGLKILACWRQNIMESWSSDMKNEKLENVGIFHTFLKWKQIFMIKFITFGFDKWIQEEDQLTFRYKAKGTNSGCWNEPIFFSSFVQPVYVHPL